MKKISTFLVVVFFVVLLSLALLAGCDNLKKYTGHTVSFEIFDGRVSVASQEVTKMTKATMPEVSADLLPPYATIDGYTLNGFPWDFEKPVTADMTLVANIVFDFSSALNVNDTGSNEYVIQSTKDEFDDTYLYIPAKINNKTVTVSQEAFLGCASLKKIEFAQGVKINHTAFKACANLEEVILPQGMTKIEKNVFNNCEKLKIVIFPDSLTTIDEGAFLATAIESLSLNKVQYIYKDAFKDCTKLEEIKLPQISELGQEAFAGCTVLKKFDNDVKKIGIGVFKDCTSIEEVNIRKVTAGVPTSFLENATSLHTVTLNLANPSSSYAVGLRAFAGCTSLKDIDTSKVKKIENEAFKNCNLLSSINLSKTTYIGEEAFSIDNDKLLVNNIEITFADMNIAPALTDIGKLAFFGRSNIMGILSLKISSSTKCGTLAFGNTGIEGIYLYTTSTASESTLLKKFEDGWRFNKTADLPYVITKI